MKISLLNNSDSIGGAAIACKRLHLALLKENLESNLLVQDKKTDISSIIDLSNSQVNKKFAIIRLAFEKSIFLFFEKSSDLRFAFSLANTGINILKKYNFSSSDIIHIHWFQQGFLSLKGLQKLFLLKKPVVWTLHDMWAFTGGCHHNRECLNYMESCHHCPYLKIPGRNDLSARIWKRKNEIYSLNNFTIVTPSKWLANIAKSSSLLKGKKICNIPNPINTKFFTTKNKTDSRKKLNLPESKILIGFAALNTNSYFKGHTYLLEALRLFHTKYPDLAEKIMVVMLGKYKQNEKNLIPYHVITPGYIYDESQLIDFYNAIDLFILPSLEENLPNTIIEAMSCGIPAVAFNIGGIPEIIDHKLNGYLAEYKSVEDLTEGIHWILNDHNQYKILSESARNKVISKFSDEVVTSQFINLYKELIK